MQGAATKAMPEADPLPPSATQDVGAATPQTAPRRRNRLRWLASGAKAGHDARIHSSAACSRSRPGGDEDLGALEALEAVEEHRAVLLPENVLLHGSLSPPWSSSGPWRNRRLKF